MESINYQSINQFICLTCNTLSQVVVNGAHFLEYLHRLPVSRVCAISVDGGVEIMSISFQNPAVSINQTRT